MFTMGPSFNHAQYKYFFELPSYLSPTKTEFFVDWILQCHLPYKILKYLVVIHKGTHVVI